MSRFQNADERDISRNQINGAPYNPQKISRDALRRLKKHIKQYGLQGSVVVNERNADGGWPLDDHGFWIVSGHSRLRVLDLLEGSPDYVIERCPVMHLARAEEMENNLHFNAKGAQGDTDIAMLSAMFQSVDLDIDAAGYDPVVLEDLAIMTGPITGEEDDPEVQEMAGQVAAVAETSKEIQQAARDAKAEYRAREREKDAGASFLIHLAFRSSDRCAEVMQLLNDAGYQRAGEYFNGEAIVSAMGLVGEHE